ncbi:hypothetical protein THAOC_04872, partial [Thalassiosira oceanica]
MIASNAKLALSLILSVADIGTNKFALGHDDALQFDQILHGNDVSAETGLNDAGGTAPTTKFERSIRLAGVPTTTHVEVGADRGAGEHDKGFVEVGGRVLQGDCSTVPSWHPQYLGGWDGGYCAFETGCGSPGYSSELACCKSAYAGQMSGFCLSKLEAPPTTSPTTSDFTVDFWYPAGSSPETVAPIGPGGGDGGAWTAWRVSRFGYDESEDVRCLGEHVWKKPASSSPTESITNGEGGLNRNYDTAWTSAGCLNTLPLPYNNIKDRPNYSSQLECCKAAYAGQMSGACLSKLGSPPTTSPTNMGNTGSHYYPDYGTAWYDAGCINKLPVPSGRPTYTSHLACCKGAYGGQ